MDVNKNTPVDNRYTIETLLIDDNKIPDYIKPDMIARTLRAGLMAMSSFKVGTLVLDYYLDGNFDGKEVLFNMIHGSYPTLPKTIILVSSEDVHNAEMEYYVLKMGYVKTPHPKHKFHYTLSKE